MGWLILCDMVAQKGGVISRVVGKIGFVASEGVMQPSLRRALRGVKWGKWHDYAPGRCVSMLGGGGCVQSAVHCQHSGAVQAMQDRFGDTLRQR